MSQWLQNLLDRHQKTGTAATHASLTKRRKSPAPDVQLIQPQRQKKTPQPQTTNQKKKNTDPPKTKGKGLLNRETCSAWPDQVPRANPQDNKDAKSSTVSTTGSSCSDYWLPQTPHEVTKYSMTILFLISRLRVLLAGTSSTATRYPIDLSVRCVDTSTVQLTFPRLKGTPAAQLVGPCPPSRAKRYLRYEALSRYKMDIS